MLVDRFGLLSRTSEPGQHSLFRDPEHKADPGQINPDQEHLESHHDFVFRSAKVEKDCLSRLRKLRRTGVTAKETSLAALGEIRRDRTHVPTRRSAIMSTRGMGARLTPVFGCSHGSILRIV